jgi:hypothetical protein
MSNRTALLTKVHKVLKKHFKPVNGQERPLLEQMLYACVLENARPDAADEAFAKLQENFFDWNEIRVTTLAELTEVLSCLPDASEAAGRLKRSLQSVFEAHYTFDLEPMKKQALGKSEKELQKIQGATPFVQAYVVQHALGGHAIPVNRGSIELLYAVGVINDAEADKHQVPGLERAIPKNKGLEFGSLLQQMGADYSASPGSSKLKAILAEIDGGYKERLATRQSHLDQIAAKEAAAATAQKAAARAARVAQQQADAKAAEKLKKGKGKKEEKAASAAKEPLPPVTKPTKVEKPVEKEKAAEKGKKPAPPAAKKDSKGLTKKKPR